MSIQTKLLSMGDTAYRDFHSGLIPTVDKNKVIGIPVPILRKEAKKLKNSLEASAFISDLPHFYYEENNLHAFLIESIPDFSKAVSEVERFLPFIDNWATCDSLMPVSFRKNKDKLLPYIDKWLSSGDTYTVRFAIEMLMKLYLDDDYKRDYLVKVSQVKSDEYYVKMMIAWYFATALSKKYDDAVWFLDNKKLPVWEHNKSIQKAIESRRITSEQKRYLRKIKIK